jgi:hypothetical protein
MALLAQGFPQIARGDNRRKPSSVPLRKNEEARQMRKQPFSEQILFTHQLANGLHIVGRPMPQTESVALAYGVRTGSRDEHDPRLEGKQKHRSRGCVS